MSGLRPRQVQARANIHQSLGGDFSVSPRRDSAGTDQSANIRKDESPALGFFICYIMNKAICKMPDCGKPNDSHGYCGMHAQRLRRYGDVNYITSKEQFKQNCRDSALAYKDARPDVYRKLNNRHEHRVVAEQMLGRPLQRGEIVHHIDGDRHNNAPTNLEVMSQADHLRLHHAEMWVARKAKNAR